MKQCPCVVCNGEERTERTIKEHLVEYGHSKKTLLTDFLEHSTPDVKLFHYALR